MDSLELFAILKLMAIRMIKRQGLYEVKMKRVQYKKILFYASSSFLRSISSLSGGVVGILEEFCLPQNLGNIFQKFGGHLKKLH